MCIYIYICVCVVMSTQTHICKLRMSTWAAAFVLPGDSGDSLFRFAPKLRTVRLRGDVDWRLGQLGLVWDWKSWNMLQSSQFAVARFSQFQDGGAIQETEINDEIRGGASHDLEWQVNDLGKCAERSWNQSKFVEQWVKRNEKDNTTRSLRRWNESGWPFDGIMFCLICSVVWIAFWKGIPPKKIRKKTDTSIGGGARLWSPRQEDIPWVCAAEASSIQCQRFHGITMRAKAATRAWNTES